MRKYNCFLIFIGLLFILIGCTHEDDSLKKNNSLQSYRQSLVKDIMKAGKEYSKISKDSAFQYYSKAILLAHENHAEDVKPEIYYYLAILYRDASDFKKATLYLDSSVSTSSRIKDYIWQSNAYNALGNLKFDLLDSSNAKFYFDSAFQIAKRYGLNRQTGIAFASLAKFEKDINNMVRDFNDAIVLLKTDSNSEEEVAMIYVNLGLYVSNPDTAIHYFKSAIEIGQHVNSPEVIITAYNNMVYSYLEKNEPDNAEACLKIYAIPLALKYNNFEWLSTLYDTYADVCLAKNNTSGAFKFERLSLEARGKGDEIKALEQVRLLSSLLDTKNKELLIQKKESEIHQKEKANRDLLFWGSAIIIFISGISSVLIWRQQRNKGLRMQAELITSAKHLIEAEENMKGRVSLELHDLVTPFYTSMVREIDQAGIPDQAIEVRLKEKVSDLSQALRKLSHHMNNNFREQLSLPVLLKGLCDDFRKVSDVTVEFLTYGFNRDLSDQEIIHLYRIVQELFTNALKYLKTGTIRLSLTEDLQTIFILYGDTGPGFDINTVGENGIGIKNIIERAKLINGQAILTTSPGNGTRWSITVPL